MPLMVEPLVMKTGRRGGYMVDGDIEKIVPLVRQAVELGADVIKADPTDDVADYHRVVEAAARRPGAGARRRQGADEEILARTAERDGAGRRRASSTAATSSSTPTRPA